MGLPTFSSPAMPKPTSQSPAVSAAQSAVSRAFSGPKWRMQVTMPRSVMPIVALGLIRRLADRVRDIRARRRQSRPPQKSGERKVSE